MKNNYCLIIAGIIMFHICSAMPVQGRMSEEEVSPFKQKEPREFFVATNGNDASPGTKTRPFLTVQHGIEQLTAGDTLTLLPGKWDLDSPVTIRHRGLEGSWITIRGEGSAEVLLDGSNAIIKNRGRYPNNNGLIQIEDAAYIRLQNIKVQNSDRAGINIQESNNIDVFNCKSENSLSPGIAAWQRCEYIRIFGNSVVNANNMQMSRTPYRGSEAPHEAISMAGPHHFEVAYNHVYDCRKEGIDVKETASFGSVHHNYVHHCDRQGLYIDGWFGQLQDIDMYSNVVHNCEAGIAISSEEGPNTKNLKIHHNLIFNNRATALFFSRWGADNPRENVKVYHNTFYRNGWGNNFEGDIDYWLNGGFYLYSVNLHNVHVYNNIFAQNFPFEIGHTSRYKPDFMDTQNIKIEYNLIHDVNTVEYPVYLGTWLKDTVYSVKGSNPVEHAPLFIDPEAGDFRLAPGSPAINAGLAISTDDGNAKGTTDIGAFRYGTGENEFWWKEGFPPVINAFNISHYSEKLIYNEEKKDH